ncbi:hypothetical protein N7494_003679 [Penicillium frequentans]|uniref:Uncharacterized protein n=1 Tax=Penicillium frequentans TaxID=3151616 RepID=A0AAD6CZB9_9EURO|nr:hypothetical protein N7494_003679 [Penicillium glabrum]
MRDFTWAACIGVAMILGQPVLASAKTAIAPSGTNASTTPEKIWIRTYQDINTTSHVQALYDAMGGTFALPSDFGPEAHLSGIIFSNSTDNFPRPEWAQSGDVSGNTSLSLDKRWTGKVYSHECTDPPDWSNRLFSYNAQLYMNGVLCDRALKVAPYAWGGIALIFSKVQCGERLQYLCEGIWTILGVAASDNVGPGIKSLCAEGMASLASYCYEKGGSMKVKVDQTGSLFEFGGYCNSKTTESCETISSDDKCETIVCSGQCNPGHKDP